MKRTSKTTIILADPPWAYRNYTAKVNGAAASAMDTMRDADISALAPCVSDIAGRDAVLAMWATWPKLDVGMQVLRAWGFDYVTGFPWVKMTRDGTRPSPGVGYWTRGTTEMLLIGRKGKPKRTSPRTSTPAGLLEGGEDWPEAVFYAPKGKQHSQKPLGIHTWLAEMFEGARLVELFARREATGWECYGFDTGWRITPEGVKAYEQAI